MKSIVVISALLFSAPVLAQKLIVTKVKGSQAIVNVSNGKLETGQIIDLSDDETPEFSSAGGGGGRDNVIGFAGSVKMLEDDANGSKINTTEALITLAYGWNRGTVEFGPIGILGMADRGGAAGNVTTFGAGGFFDFNFSPNRPGNDSIFGAGVQGTYQSTSGGGASSSVTTVVPSGFLKWFVLGRSSTALRFDLGYQYQSQGGGSSRTISGLIVGAGFGVYF